MSVLWRILSVAALAVSAVMLILAILSVRKEQRVRPGLDLLRLGVTVVTTVLMARLLGVRTSEALMGLGFLIGLLLGIYEGLHLRVRFLGRGTFARRTILGVVAWGVGVVLVQAAGVIGRIGLADFGLALSFLGIGQVVGLLTGRWQTVLAARRAAAGAAGVTVVVALVLAGLLLPGMSAPAAAADAVDVRAVMGGQVPGVAVEVRGTGWWYGASLSLTFTNETGVPVAVAVPMGLQFVPADETVQTMIAAGGETIAVPPLGTGETYSTEIQAFCGQHDDSAPSVYDVFTAGEVVTGDLAVLVEAINQSGSFDANAQDAVWSLTDDYDISGNPAASALVQGTGQTVTVGPVPAVDNDPGNLMWNCGDRALFGDRSQDRSRCFTFRYTVPAGGIRSAVVYMAIEAPTGSLQDTDEVAVAVGEGFSEQCSVGGDMPGCVRVHGGFAGGERSLTIDLLDLACDATSEVTPAMQAAVLAQLQTGVLHMVLQDDTALHGARLALNEGPALLPCGTSVLEAPLASGNADIEEELPYGRDEGEEGDYHHLSAGEGTRTSAVGMAGAAALLLTSLAGSGASPASLAAAWRGRGWRGVRDLAAGVRGGSPSLPGWFDPAESLAQGRARAALEQVPLKWRSAVQEMAAARFDADQVEKTAAAVRSALGAVDPAADPAAAIRGNPAAARLLDRLPGDARARIEEKILAGLQEERLGTAVDEALIAARRDRAVALLRHALARRDGAGVQRVMAALEEKDRAGTWSRATRGLDVKMEDLEYPPPAPEGSVAVPAKLDLAADLDLEADLGEVVARGEEMKEVLSRLPAEARPKAEARLLERLKADRVTRWVEKLRNARGTPAAGGSVLDVPEVQSLLELLPPGLREEVGAAAARVLDGEAVEHLASHARRMVEQDHAMDLLRKAIGLGDGDGADAVMEAVSAGLAAADRADLDRLVERATGGAGLAGLTRSGSAVAPVHLTEHLTGEADLLGAVRRTPGVGEVLQRSGSLRPQVEASLVQSLGADRVNRAVQQAASQVGLGHRAAADLLSALRELPGVKKVLDRLPAESREEAYRVLGERLEADGLEAAVTAVERALHLDRAEKALLEAAAAEDLEMADAALAGLPPDEARALEAAAFKA